MLAVGSERRDTAREDGADFAKSTWELLTILRLLALCFHRPGASGGKMGEISPKF